MKKIHQGGPDLLRMYSNKKEALDVAGKLPTTLWRQRCKSIALAQYYLPGSLPARKYSARATNL